MYVDGAGPYRGTAAGRFQGLDLVEPLYLGGVPDFKAIHRLTGHSQGFVGMHLEASSCYKKILLFKYPMALSSLVTYLYSYCFFH